jgi:hypothetical protein
MPADQHGLPGKITRSVDNALGEPRPIVLAKARIVGQGWPAGGPAASHGERLDGLERAVAVCAGSSGEQDRELGVEQRQLIGQHCRAPPAGVAQAMVVTVGRLLGMPDDQDCPREPAVLYVKRSHLAEVDGTNAVAVGEVTTEL